MTQTANQELRDQLQKSLELLIKVYNKEEVDINVIDLMQIESTLLNNK